MSDNVIPLRQNHITVSRPDSPWIVQTPPRVLIPEAVRFVQGFHIVGTVDATYDFSNCPPEYHQLALQVLSQSRTTIRLPFDDHSVSTPADKREYENMTLGYIGRFFRWLCGGGWK